MDSACALLISCWATFCGSCSGRYGDFDLTPLGGAVEALVAGFTSRGFVLLVGGRTVEEVRVRR